MEQECYDFARGGCLCLPSIVVFSNELDFRYNNIVYITPIHYQLIVPPRIVWFWLCSDTQSPGYSYHELLQLTEPIFTTRFATQDWFYEALG